MIFRPLELPGAFLVEVERLEDERGFFARTFCRQEFEAAGLDPRVAQCSLSVNRRRGTLRGMHWQAEPHAECKLVRCVRGALYDVLIDLRADSPFYRHWCSVELTAERRNAVYVPEGVAHGFLTLEDDVEVYYQMSVPYAPEAARGVRWDDPAFDIAWPATPAVVSDRDASYPDFEA
jgi:dTDP-4-dehydrorhamnose 3,5-epimerase